MIFSMPIRFFMKEIFHLPHFIKIDISISSITVYDESGGIISI